MKTSVFLSLACSVTVLNSFGIQVVTNTPAPVPKTPARNYEQRDWSIRTSSAKEIVRMKEAGLEVSVIRAYIQNSNAAYRPTVDDIIYLHEHQVSDELIAEWIKKGAESLQTMAPAPAPAPTAPPQLSHSTPQANTQPAPVVVTQPTVVYQTVPQVVTAPPVYVAPPAYVDYGPSFYVSPFSFHFSHGWGGHHHWGRSHFYHSPFRHHRHHFGGHFGHHGIGGSLIRAHLARRGIRWH